MEKGRHFSSPFLSQFDKDVIIIEQSVEYLERLKWLKGGFDEIKAAKLEEVPQWIFLLKRESESRSFAGFAMCGDYASVLHDDSFYCCESDPCALKLIITVEVLKRGK